MEKVKYFQRNSLLRVDTFSESVSSQHSRSSVQYLKIQKLAEEANEIKKKRIAEENKRNRIKLALELHQQMYNELELAAVCIQKHVRMFLAKKIVRKIMAQKLEYEKNLILLQKNIGEIWMQDFCVKHIAAFRIQRFWKGFRKYPPKIDLVKRLVKTFLENKNFKKVQLLKNFQRKTAEKLGCLNRKFLDKIQEIAFFNWKNFQVFESSESSESPDPNVEETVETLKSSKITENPLKPEENPLKPEENPSKPEEKPLKPEEKPLKPEEIQKIPISEKPKLLKPEILQKFPQIPEYPKPKNFILSEANFHRATFASKGKRFDTPEEVQPTKKSKKLKTLKTRRLLKQTTSRLVYIHEKNQENQKREQSARPRMTSEVKFRVPAIPQLSSIPSKIRESLLKRAQRSTSFSVERKESFRKDEEKSEDQEKSSEKREKQEKQEKTQNNLPTLNFQQALPDLFGFLENYGPNLRKNPVIQSTAGLIVHRLK